MTVLGIETSTTVCAAAIVRDGAIVAEAGLEERYVHAERIMSLIDEVTGRQAKVDAIAVSAGPGSFTGLRIGVSSAKGLAFAWDVPLIAVPTLESLADHAVNEKVIRPGECILALVDARRDEVYAQLFELLDGSIAACDVPRDLSITKIPALVGTRQVVVIGDGSTKCASMLNDATAAIRSQFRFPVEKRIVCSASAVARVGARMLAAGKIAAPSTLEPMYIKEFFLTTR